MAIIEWFRRPACPVLKTIGNLPLIWVYMLIFDYWPWMILIPRQLWSLTFLLLLHEFSVNWSDWLVNRILPLACDRAMASLDVHWGNMALRIKHGTVNKNDSFHSRNWNSIMIAMWLVVTPLYSYGSMYEINMLIFSSGFFNCRRGNPSGFFGTHYECSWH